MGKKKQGHNAIKRMAYQVPEDGFRSLKQTRDYALMLADLTAPVTQAEGEEPVPLSRFALAYCFERIAGDLDQIVQGAWWPGE